MKKRMVVTDLDGTLAAKGTISDRARVTLRELGEKSVVRVIATGRSLQSARALLGNEFPIDYLVFSSGAGIVDWRSKEVIRSAHLALEEVQAIANTLSLNHYDFMVHDPIPENHLFAFHHFGTACPDYFRRLNKLRAFARPLTTIFTMASQFLVVIPAEKTTSELQRLKMMFPKQSVVRATSPLDGESGWLEIFSAHVCKSEACAWLCERDAIATTDVLAVGNDYNDVDLLQWAGTARVMEDCPEELSSRFSHLHGAGADGFVEAVRVWLGQTA